MLPLLFAGPPAPSVTAADLRTLDCPVTIALGEHWLSNTGTRGSVPLAIQSLGDSAGCQAPLAHDTQGFSQLVLNELDRD
jgi:hypothetical protein